MSKNTYPLVHAQILAKFYLYHSVVFIERSVINV